jgi:alpha-ribazole phosphatase
MAALELFLIRHPRPAGGEGLCYGRLDLPLADSANAAADRLRPLLPADAPLFTSPLQRCHLLAASLRATAQVEARLAEMHFGDWEGAAWDAIPRPELDAWAADISGYAPPGGEAPAAVLARLLDWTEELHRNGTSRAIAVSHAGPIRLLLCHVLGLPLSHWERLPIDFGSLTQLRLTPHGGQLLACNL